MQYEKPELREIKMDAEIGAYQNDFDPGPNFSEPTPASLAPESAQADA